MKNLRNEDGIALMMVLVLSAISLAAMAAMMYMMTVRTQMSGIQKRYSTAYEAAMVHTSTQDAPWFVVPADRKWYRNLVVARIIIEALASFQLILKRSGLIDNSLQLLRRFIRYAKPPQLHLR